jgi:predicted nucleotidyltransferase
MIRKELPIASQLFGSELKMRILTYLYSQVPVSERELARVLGVSNTAVNKAMKQLAGTNAVKGTVLGGSTVWELNKRSFTFPIIKTFFEEMWFTPLRYIKKEISEGIHAELEKINRETHKGGMTRPRIISAHLFGSAIDGTAKPGSDIDVLIILEKNWKNENLRDALREQVGMPLLEKTGRIISFHVYCRRDVENKSPIWLKRAVDSGERVF